MGRPAPTFPRGTQWRVTYLINVSSPRPQGWSESYYIKGLGYNNALLVADNIWQQRRDTLADDCTLEYAWIGDIGIQGDSLVYDPGPGNRTGTLTGTGTKTLPPWNVVRLRLESGPLYHTFRPVRGIPGSENLSAGTVQAGVYLTNLQAFASELLVDTLNRCKNNPFDPAPGGLFKPITNFIVEQYAERKSGRPFGLLRGRSRQPGA